MKETYNTTRIKELLEESDITRTKWRRNLNIQDDRQAIKYIDGGDLHVSRLLQIAEQFGVSVAEFFLHDNIRLDRARACHATNEESDDVKLLKQELKHTKEMMEVKMAYERRIGELTKEIEMLKREQTKPSPPQNSADTYITDAEESRDVFSMAAEPRVL